MSERNEPELLTVFGALVGLYERRGLPPLTMLPTPYDYGHIGPWQCVINGGETACEWTSPGLHIPRTIPPFTLYVEYNGWPAGFLTPVDGVIEAGAAANEEALIEALEGAA